MEKLSVIIPTYNEADNIRSLINYLNRANGGYLKEVIVADGGSTDDTRQEARNAGAEVVFSPEKGRAAQMNAGAEEAKGSILYFLHSDTYPPEKYDTMIVQAVRDQNSWGCFRIRFDQRHWVLLAISSLVNLNFTFFRFGDQSLFVKRELFYAVGKFDTSQIVFEDTGIARRLRASSKGKIIAPGVTTSARKFRRNGVYKMTLTFIYVWVLYLLGVSHTRILATYKRLIIQDKI